MFKDVPILGQFLDRLDTLILAIKIVLDDIPENCQHLLSLGLQ